MPQTATPMASPPEPAVTGYAQLQDLAARVGQLLRENAWFAAEHCRIEPFATLTDDPEWLHTDPERAGGGPFGTTTADGFLTSSLLPDLMAQAGGGGQAVARALRACLVRAPAGPRGAAWYRSHGRTIGRQLAGVRGAPAHQLHA